MKKLLSIFTLLILTGTLNKESFSSEKADIIITNGTVLTMDNEKNVIENGVVVIKDNKILEVGQKGLEKKYKATKNIDANEGIIMPGMINTHTHASMSVFRSLADDVPDRLTRYLFPLENKMVSPEMVYLGALHGSVEMAKAGVTTVTDMYYFEDEVAKAVKKIGLRGVLGETVIKFPVADAKEPFGGIDYAKKFIETYKNDELITPAFAPHAPHTNDTEHLQIINKLSKEYNVPVLMHVAETEKESEFYKEKYNMSPVEYLDSIGVLDQRFVAAHLIFVNDNDIEILKKRDVGVAHNMVANIKSAKGISPALKMHDQGLRVGLGTDGPMSGNTLDIIGQMGYVAKLHKLDTKDRSALPPIKAVEMATIGGAKALHMEDKIGSLETGKLADVVIVETQSANMVPLYDAYSALVYSANASNVETVIVNGKIIVENKVLKTYDEKLSRKNMNDFKNKVIKIAETL
ncbi:amidohydrolase [Cetobacterium sp. 2A]|uniref:amidohydrolase n=1 Tax=unclassified Cetobacterium TaxID=2630983 RepID=UPI00163D12F4|nr:amidohydrolase [Cetobacterium sp. 2A]MBC2857141.1 amidohydrolase [Cetobacterium sp. 2A]